MAELVHKSHYLMYGNYHSLPTFYSLLQIPCYLKLDLVWKQKVLWDLDCVYNIFAQSSELKALIFLLFISRLSLTPVQFSVKLWSKMLRSWIQFNGFIFFNWSRSLYCEATLDFPSSNISLLIKRPNSLANWVMLFFKSRDKLLHVKLFKWLGNSLTAFKIEFSLSSIKLLASLSVRVSDEDKLYLLKQALHICFLRSVISSLSIRILNESSLFIDSLTFNNVWSAAFANISWLRQPQAASNLLFFLGWLEECALCRVFA